MADLSDEELLQQYRAATSSLAKESTLNQLFQRHHGRVAAWCYRLTGDVDASADLAQEIFLKVLQRLDSFRGESKFTTWLYTVARNHCMDQLRARSTAQEQTVDAMPDQIEDKGLEEISMAMERRQSEELVRKLMRETLDDTEARVMTLHYVHEMPLDSVTRLLRLTNTSGAKAHIVNARRKLARALALWQSREAGIRGNNNA